MTHFANVSLVLALVALPLGMIIGSFLGVVADRWNTGRTIAGRSFCFSCSRTLSWYELIPVVSFLMQRGRCRGCRTGLSMRHLFVELVTGLAFFTVAYMYAPLFFVSTLSFVMAFVLFTSMWSVLIIILLYDLKHMIIPDELVLVFILLGVVSVCVSFVPSVSFVAPSLFELISPFLLALPFAGLWLVSRGRWIGLGDAKLMVGIGYLLGFAGGIAGVLLGFWVGAIVGIILLLLKKWRFTMKSEIPFAPFLILGTFLAFAFQFDIWSIVSFLSL